MQTMKYSSSGEKYNSSRIFKTRYHDSYLLLLHKRKLLESFDISYK